MVKPQLTTCGRSAIFIYQKPTPCNGLAMVMGSVSWKVGSWEVVKLTTTTQLKMEDACILCNVIKLFGEEKW